MLKIWLKRKHTADSIHCQLIKIEVKSITSLCRHFSLKIQSHHCTMYKEVFLKNQKIKKSQDNTIYRWQHFCLLFLFHVLRYISEISVTLNKSLKAMLSQVQFLSNWLDTENLFRKKTNSRQCQLIKIQVKKWYQYADILY